MMNRTSILNSAIATIATVPMDLTAEPPSGTLDVLNIGTGHLSFKFDNKNPGETDNARRVIQDMVKRGYLIFVETGGECYRVRDFDPELDEYLVDAPAETPTGSIETEVGETKRRRGRKLNRVAMKTAKATGVGPTAGG